MARRPSRSTAAPWAFVLTILLISISALSGCGTLRVVSTPPDAEVRLVSTREAESKVIGRTPLTVATSDVPKGVDDGPVLLEVSKEGFQAKTLLLPNLPGSSLSFELVLEPREGLDYRAINRILAIAFQAERDLLQKRFEETLKGAESLKAINPNLAIAYQLEGSVSFLKGDLEKSRHAWRRALELNPEDPEARNMLNAIEKDSPSETAPAKSTP